MNYQEINARTIDSWVEGGWEWGKPISHEDYAKALRGEWDVLLTPVRPVPHEWFGDLKEKKLLGLASGGGQQMPVFAALGADCTVFDYSEKQLENPEQMKLLKNDPSCPKGRRGFFRSAPFGCLTLSAAPGPGSHSRKCPWTRSS